MTTKPTSSLTAGDTIVIPEVDRKSFIIPISPQHPGYRATVLSVGPCMITAGPYAGQQARKGRRNTGEPLLLVTMQYEGPVPDTHSTLHSATADEQWTMAG